jgi:hypothetical protein
LRLYFHIFPAQRQLNPATTCHPRGGGVLGKAKDSQRRIYAFRQHRRAPRQIHRSFDPQSTWAFRMTMRVKYNPPAVREAILTDGRRTECFIFGLMS